jgi:hypothetical protein
VTQLWQACEDHLTQKATHINTHEVPRIIGDIALTGYRTAWQRGVTYDVAAANNVAGGSTLVPAWTVLFVGNADIRNNTVLQLVTYLTFTRDPADTSMAVALWSQLWEPVIETANYV